ncbi:hypothetical protein CHARACLAT_014927 [Characodon lateralis]|uniref:Consortin N-terminal domain-containing protein n=1 Tax=Characodon lateralis TaxID=208331 RepID=A0ABU7D7J7_9TELE|nr:hypothetical protein [Characodon lateralis]
MLNGGREGLFELGQQLQQQGEYQAALHCFLSCLLGLTHVQSFTSLPNCLHQIAELFITEKNYGKALQFIQAEKMFYEVALIELTALQGSSGPQEEATLSSAGWITPDELSEQASQAQHLERLAQLCIMSKHAYFPRMENPNFDVLNVLVCIEKRDTTRLAWIWCLLPCRYLVQAIPYTVFSLPLLSLWERPFNPTAVEGGKGWNVCTMEGRSLRLINARSTQ